MEPWYKVAIPRKEVREGRSFNPDEFAIALEQIVAGTAPEAVAPDPPRGVLFPEMRPGAAHALRGRARGPGREGASRFSDESRQAARDAGTLYRVHQGERGAAVASTIRLSAEVEAVERRDSMKPSRGNSTVASLVDKMVRRIVERFRPERVILFGSHSRGTAGPGSDVDLLVVMPVRGSKREKQLEIRLALREFHIPKDIIVTTPEEFAWRQEIPGTIERPAAREGRVLYARP